MIVKLNRAFKDIVYVDRDHSYLNIAGDKKLVPTTTYKKQFQNPFSNKEYWLKKKAEEANITVEEMQDEWDCLRETGVKRGSIIHDYLEALSLRKYFNLSLDLDGMAKLKRQALHYNMSYRHSDMTIATEFVVGNEEIGGTIDKLIKRVEIKGYEINQIGIIDYKTDSKTEEELKKSWNKKMLGHLSYLDDSILNGYFVQVNIYRQLLELKGFKIDFMEIAHFSIHNDDYKIYTVPFIDVLNINSN